MISRRLFAQLTAHLSLVAAAFFFLGSAAHADANGEPNTWGNSPPIQLLTRLLAKSLSQTQGCAPPPYTDLDALSPSNLKFRLTEHEHARDYCQASAGAYELMHRPSESKDVQMWLTSELDFLLLAEDYRDTIIQGLRGMRELHIDPNNTQAMEVRYRIVKAVAGAALRLGANKDLTWVRFALGIEQATGPQAELLTCTQFLTDFPTSPLAKDVLALQSHMIDLLFDSELAIAKDLVNNRLGYFAAIMRLESLYQYPFSAESPRLNEVLETVIGYELQFARLLVSHPKTLVLDANGFEIAWTDNKLAQAFHEITTEGEPVDRQAIATLLLARANKAMTYLETNDHTGVWASKAHSLFQRYSLK
jgi:hypothetical protein